MKKKTKQFIAQLQAENAKLREEIATLCSEYTSEEALIIRINHEIQKMILRATAVNTENAREGATYSFKGMREMLEDAGGIVVEVTPSKDK